MAITRTEVNIFAEDQLGEKRGGGGADGASVTFETRLVARVAEVVQQNITV